MTSIKKIIFVVASPFNKRDNERFGIELLRENGFDVCVWDLSPFLNSYRWRNAIPIDKCEPGKVFFTRREFIFALAHLSNDCFISLAIGYSYKSFSVFREISRLGLPYSFVLYNVPCFGFYPKKGKIKLLRRVFSKDLLLYFFWKLPYKFLGIKPANAMLMLGGEIELISKYPVDNTTNIIKSHYFDYDIYLKEMREPSQVDDNLGVFLDSFLPFHPDWESALVLEPAGYYSSLCNFFDFLEKKHGMRIVIAAHPRSAYENMRDYYGGRSVIRGKTANLVRKSKFVIAHQSASTSYAVLFKKPIVFVTTDSLQKIDDLGPLTEFIAGALNKTVLNLSGNFEFNPDHELVVDATAYQKFKNTYIKEEGSEDLPIWQTFANYIKNIRPN